MGLGVLDSLRLACQLGAQAGDRGLELSGAQLLRGLCHATSCVLVGVVADWFVFSAIVVPCWFVLELLARVRFRTCVLQVSLHFARHGFCLCLRVA